MIEPAVRIERLQLRERQVVAGAANGETVNDTAARLYLSRHTVRQYRARALHKLGARNMAQAAVIAFVEGLIQPGSEGGTVA